MAAIRQVGRGYRPPVAVPTADPWNAHEWYTGVNIPDPVTFITGDEWLNRPHIYPRQLTLVKIIFLRDDLFTDYDRDVIDEWIEDYKNTGNSGIQPDIYERIAICKARGYKWFREVLAVMGRRAGKGYVGALCMAYILWYYLAKGDPQDFYGVDRSKKLTALIFAGKRDQAKQNLWLDLVNVILEAPCFTPYVSKAQAERLTVYAPHDFIRMRQQIDRGIYSEMDMATFEILPKESTLMAGRGPASFMQGYDEIAHVVASGANRSAEEVYGAATPSLDQFGKDGFIYEPSSPWQMLGQFYVNYENSLKRIDEDGNPVRSDEDGRPAFPTMLMIQLSSWAIYEDWERAHLLPMFPWPDSPPICTTLKGAMQVYDEAMKEIESANPETFAVERRSHWAAALDAYLNPQKIAKMFEPWLDRPESYGPPNLEMQHSGLLIRAYKGHGDPSLSNANFGFAIAHAETDRDGRIHAVFDYITHWRPRDYENNVIDYDDIENNIWDIICQFKPDEITFDQWNCQTGSTRIATPMGLIRLDAIVGTDVAVDQQTDIAQPVFTHNDQALACRGYHKGQVEVRKVTTKMGYPIEATPEHRMWARRAKAKAWHQENPGEWIAVGDLDVGDWLQVRRGVGGGSIYQDLRALHPQAHGTSQHWGVSSHSGGWVAYGRADGRRVYLGWFKSEDEAAACAHSWRQDHPTRNRLTKYPEICDANFATLLGLMSAEANCSDERWCFGNKDKEVLKEFQRCAEIAFGGDWSYEYTHEWKGEHDYGWIRSGGATAGFLSALGLNGLSQVKSVPEIIFRSPRLVMIAYLRGLMEGDGGVVIRADGTDQVVQFETTSEQLAIGVQQLLLAVGIYSTLWEGTYRYKGQTRPRWRVKMFGPDLLDYADEIGFISTRKNSTLAHARVLVEARGEGVGLRRKHNIEGDLMWVRIAKIEESIADCYDLSVPGPESYIANGLVSHNSASTIQKLQKRVREANFPKRVVIFEKTATAAYNFTRAENFKTALNMEWIHAPYYEQAELELRFLQLKNGKIDKPDAGPIQTKDVSDCLMECVMHLVGEQVNNFMQNSLGTLRPSGSMLGGVDPFPQARQDPLEALSGFSRARGQRPDSPRVPGRTGRGRRRY